MAKRKRNIQILFCVSPEEKQELKEMVKELWRILRSSQLK